jgi:hypothetical protein
MQTGFLSGWPGELASIARAFLPLALAGLSASAAAQQGPTDCVPLAAGQTPEIRSGMCMRSTIDADDAKNENGIPYEDWRLPLVAGQAVQIDLDALASQRPAPAGTPAPPEPIPFDSFLELRRAGAAQPLAVNDDRPGSLNSTIRFTATQTGDYVVRVRPLAGGAGDYILRVAQPPPPPVAVHLSEGGHQIQRSEQTRAALQERLFTFEGHRGERVRITFARRGGGDRLRLVGPEGRPIVAAGLVNGTASIFAVLEQRGTYRLELRLRNIDPTEALPTLNFERFAKVSSRLRSVIAIGATVEGDIGVGSPASRDIYGGPPMLNELYELNVPSGRTVTVLLDSTEFDPVLDAGAMSPLGFATALSDDDGGEGLNSRLVLRPDHSGNVILRVRALGNRLGAFHLRVVSGEAPPPAD